MRSKVHLLIAMLVAAFIAPFAVSASASAHDTSRYTVLVKTGDRPHAGLDGGNVSIYLHGTWEQTGQMNLSTSGNDFEPGKLDSFHEVDRTITNMQWVNLRLEARGDSHDWFLDYIIVTNEETGERGFFPYFNWVKVKRGDNSIRIDRRN